MLDMEQEQMAHFTESAATVLARIYTPAEISALELNLATPTAALHLRVHEQRTTRPALLDALKALWPHAAAALSVHPVLSDVIVLARSEPDAAMAPFTGRVGGGGGGRWRRRGEGGDGGHGGGGGRVGGDSGDGGEDSQPGGETGVYGERGTAKPGTSQYAQCVTETGAGRFAERRRLGLPSHELVVDRICGEAVLKGADIFAKGVRGASMGIKAGDPVILYAEVPCEVPCRSYSSGGASKGAGGGSGGSGGCNEGGRGCDGGKGGGAGNGRDGVMAAAATETLTPHLLLRGAAPVTLDGLVFLGVGEATLDRNLIFTAQRGMAARVVHAAYGDVEAINGVYIARRRGAEKGENMGENMGEKGGETEDGKKRDDADAKKDETKGEGSDVGKGGDAKQPINML